MFLLDAAISDTNALGSRWTADKTKCDTENATHVCTLYLCVSPRPARCRMENSTAVFVQRSSAKVSSHEATCQRIFDGP